jgi:hypothetical protein
MVSLTRAGLVIAAVLLLRCRVQAFESPACTPRTLTSYAFRGHVKSVRVEEGAIDGGRRTLIGRYAFDRHGRLLEDAHGHVSDVSSDRIQYQVFRYLYDSHERDYEVDTFDVDSLQKRERPIDLHRHTYKFDSQGRCSEEQDVDSDGESDGRTTYEYESQKDSIRETTYTSEGRVFSIQDRKYSPDHRLLFEKGSENRSDQDSLDYQWSRAYRYDAQGNQTDMFSYQQSALEAHWIWTYDERRRLTSSQLIVADPAKDQHAYGFCGDCGLSSGRTICNYDSNDRITEERVFQPDDKLVRLNSYKYDDHGNRTREWVYEFGPSGVNQQKTTLKLDGTEYVATWSNGLPTSTFSYDSHGNWIKKVSSSRTAAPDAKAQITSITYRVIEYY